MKNKKVIVAGSMQATPEVKKLIDSLDDEMIISESTWRNGKYLITAPPIIEHTIYYVKVKNKKQRKYNNHY